MALQSTDLRLPADLLADKDIVMAAVQQNGRVLEFVDESFRNDLKVQLIAARSLSATEALKTVRQMRSLPDQDLEAHLSLAIAVLDPFPVSPAHLKINERLYAEVEKMVKHLYSPNNKRDRAAFETDCAEMGFLESGI